MDENKFARSFASFEDCSDTSDVGEFDSSLEEIGVLIYDEASPSLSRRDWRGSIRGGGACSLVPLAFKEDSSYQNTAEFIGAMFVIIIMRRLGYQNIKVKLRGGQHISAGVVTQGEIPQRSHPQGGHRLRADPDPHGSGSRRS
jgi:hypothetical protein